MCPKEMKSVSWNRYLTSHIHYGVSHNSQDRETTWVPICRCEDKDVRTYDGIYSVITRRPALPIGTIWMKLEGIMLSKVKVKVLVAQSCPTLCDPMNCSPPGSFVHGIFQARILEWVATHFSRGSSWFRDQTQVSHIAGRFFSVSGRKRQMLNDLSYVK